MAKSKTCKPAAAYRTDAPRIDGWTYDRQATFLLMLAHTGLVTAACKAAEMSITAAYRLRNEERGAVFALGWRAAHLIARERLEDVMLEVALSGVETVTTRVETTTSRQGLNPGLSMAVLNRLDRRAADPDDPAMAATRSIAQAFDAYIMFILEGGTADQLAAFFDEHPDPLAVQAKQAAALKSAAAPAVTMPQLVENSAIFQLQTRRVAIRFSPQQPAPWPEQPQPRDFSFAIQSSICRSSTSSGTAPCRSTAS